MSEGSDIPDILYWTDWTSGLAKQFSATASLSPQRNVCIGRKLLAGSCKDGALLFGRRMRAHQDPDITQRASGKPWNHLSAAFDGQNITAGDYERFQQSGHFKVRAQDGHFPTTGLSGQ
jgi:hypothetical protein